MMPAFVFAAFILSHFFSLLQASSPAFDTYIVLLHDPPILHYNGSLPDLPPPPRRPNGRPDILSIEAQRYASFLSDLHDDLLQSVVSLQDYGSASDVIDAAAASGRHSSINMKLYSYHYLVNGFAARLTTEQADAIRRREGVVSVERDGKVRKWTTYTPEWMGLSSPAGGAWKEATPLGVAGAGDGIVIGFVDTGIDPSHPSFSDTLPGHRPYRRPTHFSGGCDFRQPYYTCNNKLLAARHFSAAILASGQLNASSPDNSPFDGDGHGTHTSSTAAGNAGIPVQVNGLEFGTASGIAPRAHIAVYKSMFRDVGGYFSDTVAAMDQAVQDGVDILNLSIGPAEPPSGLSTFFSAMEVAALSAVKAGVFVVQAAGNSGPAPGSVASFSPWVFTVGAACHNRVYENSVVLQTPESAVSGGSGSTLSINGYGLSPGTKGEAFYDLITAEEAAKMEYKWNSTTRDKWHRRRRTVATCQNPDVYDKLAVAGRILVCRYTPDFIDGTASLQLLLSTASGLSAAGVIVTVESATAGADLGQFPSVLPAILVPSPKDSRALLAYIRSSIFNASRPAARIMGGLKAKYIEREAEVAVYSSRGPDLANDRHEVAEIMKPDVMAPGEMIWAAWSPTGDEDDDFAGSRFALMSGTSMAAPHVAGVAALIKQKHPWMGPAGIASALTTTATTVDRQRKPLMAQSSGNGNEPERRPATPFDFGGGELNATAAMHPGLVFDADFHDYVEALCGIRGAAVQVLHSTGANCGREVEVDTSTTATRTKNERMGDLNKPSVTVANLRGERTVRRVARWVGDEGDNEEEEEELEELEVYEVKVEEEPEGVEVRVRPETLTVGRKSPNGEVVEIYVTMKPLSSSSQPSFGAIVLSGSAGHNVRMPISVISRSLPDPTTP